MAEEEGQVMIDLDAALLASSPSERSQRGRGGFGGWAAMSYGGLVAEDDPTVVVRDFAYERPAAVTSEPAASPVVEAAGVAAGVAAAAAEDEGSAAVQGGLAETSPRSQMPRNAGILDTGFTFGSPSCPRQTADITTTVSPVAGRRVHSHRRNRTTAFSPVPFPAPAHAHTRQNTVIDFPTFAPSMPGPTTTQPVRNSATVTPPPTHTAADGNEDAPTDKPLTRAERRRLERRGVKADKDRAKALTAGSTSSKIPIARGAATTSSGEPGADSSISSSSTTSAALTSSAHSPTPSALPPVAEHRTARSYMHEASSASSVLSQALNKALLGRRNKSREEVSGGNASTTQSTNQNRMNNNNNSSSKDKGKGTTKASASTSSASSTTPTISPVVSDDDADVAALSAPFPSYGADNEHHSSDALPDIDRARLGPYPLPYAQPFPSPAPAGVRRPDLVAETWREAEEPERTAAIRERGVGSEGRTPMPAWRRWVCCCCEAETYWEFDICSRLWCCHKMCRSCLRVG